MRALLICLVACACSGPETLATPASRASPKSGPPRVVECGLDVDWDPDEMARVVVDRRQRPFRVLEVRILAWKVAALDNGEPLHEALLWLRLPAGYVLANVNRYPAEGASAHWTAPVLIVQGSDVTWTVSPSREYAAPPTQTDVAEFLKARSWHGRQALAGQVCDPLVPVGP